MPELLTKYEIADKEITIIKLNIKKIELIDVIELSKNIQKLIIDNRIEKMILDMKEVKDMASPGIGLLLSINKATKTNLRIACPTKSIRHVFELSSLTSIIKVFDTIEKAVNSF